MRVLRDGGHSVVFVSHRLDEVLEVCDDIVVFKDGEKVRELARAEASEAVLYQLMVGEASSGEYYKTDRQRRVTGEVLIKLEGVGLKSACKNINLELRRGEILGICGVTGSGKEDVCAILCGDSGHTSGRFLVDGREVRFRQPSDALRHGILSVPKERREEGMCESMTVEENICLSNLAGVKLAGMISAKRRREVAREYIAKLNIKCGDERDSLESLSGGNAQKVVFARALFSGAKVLILNHPTRGVDVGAKSEIYAIIRDLAANGISIILLGDTLEECIGLSDRLLVMKDGLITRSFIAPPGAKPSQVDIIQYMM
jgi:ribose transport system ATP-binding protein